MITTKRILLLPKIFARMQRRRRSICGTTFYRNTKFGFNAKKLSTILLRIFTAIKESWSLNWTGRSIMKKLGGKKLFTLVAGTPIMGKDCIPKIVWLKEEKPEIEQVITDYIDEMETFAVTPQEFLGKEEISDEEFKPYQEKWNEYISKYWVYKIKYHSKCNYN